MLSTPIGCPWFTEACEQNHHPDTTETLGTYASRDIIIAQHAQPKIATNKTNAFRPIGTCVSADWHMRFGRNAYQFRPKCEHTSAETVSRNCVATKLHATTADRVKPIRSLGPIWVQAKTERNIMKRTVASKGH